MEAENCPGMENGDRSVGFRLKSVNNLIRRKLDSEFDAMGCAELCGIQGPVIGYIYDRSRQQDVFQRDIERQFNIRRSTATVMLQGLEQKGFVLRVPVAWDARLKKILLTDKAIEQNFEIHRTIDRFNARLEEGLTQEEKDQFFLIMDKITENLKQEKKK